MWLSKPFGSLSTPRSKNTSRRQRNHANLRPISTSSTTPLSFSVGLWNCQSAVNKSPIRTVIVSQGDVSDYFTIYKGVVGDLIAIRIQDVCVFLSPPPWKSPAELPTVFDKHQGSCGNLIAVRIHISEFTRRNRFKIQCFNPFLSSHEHRNFVPRCNLHIISECWKVLKEQYFMTAPPQATGSRKEEKHIHFQMGLYYGSSRYAIQF